MYIIKKKDNQQGTILLIAVMIMATLLTAALGTGTLVINIINQSASIDYSISAFYAAQAGIEKNLYRVRKDGYIPELKIYGDLPIDTNSETLNSGETLQSHYDLSAINGKDQIIFDLKENQEYEVDLYNPNNTAAQTVAPVQLTLSGTGNADSEVTIQITAVSWTQNNLNIPDAVVRTVPAGEAIIAPVIPINLGLAHIHKVKFKVFGGDLENLYLTAEDSSPDLVVMPGIYVLSSTGSFPANSSRMATQILTVEMPILEPAYGLYNYVIFSEGAIDKSVSW
jgi:hypothetical protein